ncbi:MAG: divergent polysaccharide deacetylase family protein [Zetaproteobacteria bacterium]|nr:divergent polysaccharide deacetylase family protein [Zetaproteobacteria bacterium]
MLVRFFDAPRWVQAVVACTFSLVFTLLTFWVLIPDSPDQVAVVDDIQAQADSEALSQPMFEDFSADAYIASHHLEIVEPVNIVEPHEQPKASSVTQHVAEVQTTPSAQPRVGRLTAAKDVEKSVALVEPKRLSPALPSTEVLNKEPSEKSVEVARLEPVGRVPAPLTSPPISLPPSASSLPESVRPTRAISILIDDVGYDKQALEILLNLPFPVALAVLPQAPFATESAEKVFNSGRVLMLHMPMEPERAAGRIKMDDYFLRADMKEYEVHRLVDKALQRVPHAIGMNNHMGSLLTTMNQPMQWVMDDMLSRKMFFVDSRTSAATVAADIAAQEGLRYASRNVFLDHSVKKQDLQLAWQRLMSCVEKQGHCIIIGHPHKETLDFLLHDIPVEQQQLVQPLTNFLQTAHS